MDSLRRPVGMGKQGAKVGRLPMYLVMPLGKGGERPELLDEVRVAAPRR